MATDRRCISRDLDRMLLYGLTIFLSAFLLFQVQPIIAKYILPWFGGTPAVWSTCMLFFQMLLLGGYAYAHWLSSRLRPRLQGIVHPSLIAASALILITLGFLWTTPIMPGPNWKAHGSEMPILNISLLLSVSVGLPFFVLSTTGPLLQRWFSLRYAGRSPYRLYSLSNTGSLLALLSYPFIIEPALRLRTQAWTWSILFLIYGGACAYLAVRAMGTNAAGSELSMEANKADGLRGKGGANAAGERLEEPRRSDMVLWVLLTAGASTMLLAVTNQMCQEIAVIPFLWVLPLSIYLITFIICFGHERWYPRWFPIVFVAATFVTAFALLPKTGIPLIYQIVTLAVGLFVFCMTCHGELVRLKPHPRFLTSFYLCVSIGGAIGGIFVAIVAPWIFDGFWELPVGIVFCFLLVMYVTLHDKDSWLRRKGLFPPILLISLSAALVAAGILYRRKIPLDGILNHWIGGTGIAVAVLCRLMRRKGNRVYRQMRWLSYAGMAAVIGFLSFEIYVACKREEISSLYSSRNFFGVLRVTHKKTKRSNEVWNRLIHGSIIHGIQSTSPEKRNRPLSYYSTTSGVGLVLTHHPKRKSAENSGMRIGAVGLGIGTVAAYAEEKDYICFYEINPAVSYLALGGEDLFTYLRDCPAQVDIVLGDGRLSLERELEETGPKRYDILILDAFSSDAVPVHLLTREAFDTYLAHLDEDGVLAVHVSNRHLRLAPVVWKIAGHFGLEALLIKSKGDSAEGICAASWMLLTKNRETIQIEEISKEAKDGPGNLEMYSLWTDDYSNLFQYLK